MQPSESDLRVIMFGPLKKILTILSSAVKPLTSPDSHQERPTSRSGVNVSPSPGKPQSNSRPTTSQLTAQVYMHVCEMHCVNGVMGWFKTNDSES